MFIFQVHHLQPGLLEQEALELSRRRAAQCQSEAVGLSMVAVGQEGGEVKEGASPNEVALKRALQQSCDDYDSQHPDLEEALAVSLQTLDEVAATKDSELTALQVLLHACHCWEISFPNKRIIYLAEFVATSI